MASTIIAPEQKSIRFNCAPDVLVQDLVYLSTTTGVLTKALNNNSPQPVIGVVLSKETSTFCEVALSGLITYALNIASGIIYVSSTGTFTLTPTATGGGMSQVCGVSFGNGEIFFNPEYRRIVS